MTVPSSRNFFFLSSFCFACRTDGRQGQKGHKIQEATKNATQAPLDQMLYLFDSLFVRCVERSVQFASVQVCGRSHGQEIHIIRSERGDPSEFVF